MTWHPDALQPWRDPVCMQSCCCPEVLALSARPVAQMHSDWDVGGDVVQTAATCSGRSWPWLSGLGRPHLPGGFLWCFVLCCFQGVQKPTVAPGRESVGGQAWQGWQAVLRESRASATLFCVCAWLPFCIGSCSAPVPFEIVFTFYCNVCALGSLRSRNEN